MKKITLTLAALVMTVVGFSQTIISHSSSQVPGVPSVACANGGAGFSTENNFWRTYTGDEFTLDPVFSIEGGEVGVTFADNGGTDPTATLTINAYTSDAVFPAGVLTLIATGTVDFTAADNLTLISYDFDEPINVMSTQEIILEVKFPSGEIDIVDTRMAQNADAETGPTYISTDVSCGPLAITTLTDLGFPGSGLINLRVNDEILGVDSQLLAQVNVSPNPANEVLNINVPASVELNAATLYDVLGKATNVSLSNGQINVSNLARGVYILNVDTSAGTLTEKVIIE